MGAISVSELYLTGERRRETGAHGRDSVGLHERPRCPDSSAIRGKAVSKKVHWEH